ncbi:MAG: hypothetical protein RSB41_02210 [Bacilli bacterium]
MGIFSKLKNIFYDEDIVEINDETGVTKEVAPKIEEIKEKSSITEERTRTLPEKNVSPYSERELFKPEKTFRFPAIDDEDNEDDVPLRTRSRASSILENDNRRLNSLPSRNNEVKKPEENVHETKFRPSPVISPIYGILDKNYSKEEVIERVKPVNTKSRDINYDSVRRKAYGTLEDELEDTLTKMSSKVVEDVTSLTEEIDNIDEKDRSIEDLLSEIEDNANVSIGELEEAIKDKMEEDDTSTSIGSIAIDHIEEDTEKEKCINEEIGDKTLEHDLFNLIDSMYDEREGQ